MSLSVFLCVCVRLYVRVCVQSCILRVLCIEFKDGRDVGK